jgi:hypothetical protein
MADEVQPVLAYVGHQGEVVFLKSLLEGAGIACSVDMPVWGETGVRDARVFVAQTDAEAAAQVVKDFREHGNKSSI